jgi:hypothetical protein
MKSILAIAIILCVGTRAAAEDAPKGAKALFIDNTSGTTIASAPPAAAPARSGSKPHTGSRTKAPGRNQASAAADRTTQEVSGLMYYVELVSPNGETSRVTTDRVFRSGERILLHLISSIDGEIAVYQRTPSGHAARLFPDARIANGTARIAKGLDTIVPSPTSWFRFDNEAGSEELTVVLTPRVGSAEPERAPVATQVAVVRYEEIAPVGGSKGLVVETENTGAEQATYVVRRVESGRPPEPVVVRIRLQHR